MEPARKKRIFSKEEANALLPELEKSLKDLQNKKEAYSRIHDALFMHELLFAAERSHGFLPEGTEDLEMSMCALEEAIEALAKDVEAIFEMGCFLRNIEKGHVEFRGALDGQDVFFCWRRGEPCVARYRRLHEKNENKIS